MDILRRVRWGRVLIALLVLVVLGGGLVGWLKPSGTNPYAPPADAGVVPAAEYSTALWDDLLGGDEEVTAARWEELDDPSSSDLGADAAEVALLGRTVVVADLTGTGRSAWPTYWPTDSVPPCTSAKVLAASAMELPVAGTQHYAKVLVAWQGSCADEAGSDVSVEYVYARDSGTAWVPVRDWEVPTAGTLSSATASAPAAYELKDLSGCGPSSNASVQARIVVANAWRAMCEDASTAGVELTATSGYRTHAEQLELFQEALEHYGSLEEAKRWVAYADESTCSSKHCDGTAINVSGAQALAWLNETVGCSASGAVTAASECPSAAGVVKRMSLYGFVSPVPYVPTYLEFALPLAAEKAPAECAPTSGTTATKVAQIWRCRLAQDGLTPEEVEASVSEALVVSRCESGWNPLALALGGRFRDEPHPVTGKTYDQTGVFMVSVEEARSVGVDPASLTDPVVNINAAASLWLSERSWGAWGCASGRGEVFEGGPVLPAYGGADLPAWSKEY